MSDTIVGMSLALAVVLVVSASRFNWKAWWYRKDIDVPAPPVKRSDLYFGFYGCQGDQVNETRGAINLLMESQWEGLEKTIENIRSADVDVMLDVSPQVFKRVPGGRFIIREDAHNALHDLFVRLKEDGVLGKVKVIYPIDEPNNTVGDLKTLQSAVGVIRIIASLHDELDHVKLATTYASDKDFIGLEMFDWIGYDDYDMKSSILTSDKFKNLLASLQPHQQVMLIPGAAYGQNPVPFVNYAQTNTKVAAILAFLWCDGREADVGAKGARSNGMAKTYLDVGMSIK